MKKSFGFVLLALLVVPLLLTGCAGDTPEVAENYVEALLQGRQDDAEQFACESFQGRTGELAAYFGQEDVRDLDLKYDIGKGGREEEVIVTGSFDYGPEDMAREVKLQERDRTRIILWLDEVGDDWCVNDTTTVGEGLLTLFGGAAPTVEADEVDETTDDDAAETEETAEDTAEDAD